MFERGGRGGARVSEDEGLVPEPSRKRKRDQGRAKQHIQVSKRLTRAAVADLALTQVLGIRNSARSFVPTCASCEWWLHAEETLGEQAVGSTCVRRRALCSPSAQLAISVSKRSMLAGRVPPLPSSSRPLPGSANPRKEDEGSDS
ncbi:hypothetical protein VTH06DRAFT_8354 [Thermothelomyces fergusii]